MPKKILTTTLSDGLPVMVDWDAVRMAFPEDENTVVMFNVGDRLEIGERFDEFVQRAQSDSAAPVVGIEAIIETVNAALHASETLGMDPVEVADGEYRRELAKENIHEAGRWLAAKGVIVECRNAERRKPRPQSAADLIHLIKICRRDAAAAGMAPIAMAEKMFREGREAGSNPQVEAWGNVMAALKAADGVE